MFSSKPFARVMVQELASFHLSVLLVAAVLTITAAVSDARRYRIPNPVTFGLVLLFPLFVLSAPRDVSWEQHLLVFGVVLVIGLAMFSGNLAGAGDIKLLAALALWAGPNLIGVLLVVTGLAGGLLALVLAVLAWRRQVNAGAKVSLQSLSKVAIPYGVAIALGGLAVLAKTAEPVLTFS